MLKRLSCSEEFNFGIVLDARNKGCAAAYNVLSSVQIAVTFIKSIDAAWNKDDIFSCRSNIRHFSVVQHDNAWWISG